MSRKPRRVPLGLADLKPAPWNPREITADALVGLKESLGRFGDLSGLVWNRRSGHLVAGHQRLRALQEQHGDALVFADGAVITPAGERFPVRVVDFDADTERLANLAANNPNIAGAYTPAAGAMLADLKPAHADALKALRLDELMTTLASQCGPQAGNTDPDAVPELPEKPISKTGDLWLLGHHRLLCGDSTKVEDVARVMGGERAILMNTDPPYGIDFAALKGNIRTTNAKGKLQGGPFSGVKRDGPIENDELTDGPALQAFLEAMIRAAVPHLTPTAAFYFWHPMLTQGTFFAAAAAADILIHRQIIWVKPHMVLTRSGMYHWKHELCFYGWVRGHMPPWYGDKGQVSVWECGDSQRDRMHPTQKSVELFLRPMKNHTRPGEVCYEPFCGSGSQIIAAEQLGRRCFAIEIEPRYIDVAVRRWEEFTGRKAALEKE